jgi:hypothetical protein
MYTLRVYYKAKNSKLFVSENFEKKAMWYTIFF